MADYSDGRNRQRKNAPTGRNGHDQRCVIDVYGTVVIVETDPDIWTVTAAGDWSTMLDIAEAILAADAAARGKGDRPAECCKGSGVGPHRFDPDDWNGTADTCGHCNHLVDHPIHSGEGDRG